jgi:hypothetical protein
MHRRRKEAQPRRDQSMIPITLAIISWIAFDLA